MNAVTEWVLLMVPEQRWSGNESMLASSAQAVCVEAIDGSLDWWCG